ncbi:dispatched homolog 1 [Seminavis robusta]|uniref:Dispatched homolog 1 n=1 Tax=Seminavis robusta TaxID=568900 RepID=A0A9N8DVM4_9STRA|nr:dispatched homolog 1 [Seminavis robusta]|eukprot:Sro406_g136370.1 dispatched homolog 1 (1188) ;mRNA; r:18815-22891
MKDLPEGHTPPLSDLEDDDEVSSKPMMRNSKKKKKKERVIDYTQYSFFQRFYMRMARWPRVHFWVSFVVALTLSIVGFVVGDFTVAADNAGWQSRGTLIADRQTQAMLVTYNLYNLTTDESAWDELIDNVQPGWQNGLDDDNYNGRRLTSTTTTQVDQEENEEWCWKDALVPHQGPGMDFGRRGDRARKDARNLRKPSSDTQKQFMRVLLQRQLNVEASYNSSSLNALVGSLFPGLEGCDVAWYVDGRMDDYPFTRHLWPVWKVLNEGQSALDQQVFQDLCHSEQETQNYLKEQNLCEGCNGPQQCLPPYSLVLLARLAIPDGMAMDCETLSQTFVAGGYQEETKATFQECVDALVGSDFIDTGRMPTECPLGFYPSVLDEFFQTANDGRITYTSSIYRTPVDEDTVEDTVRALYERVDYFHKGTENIEGAYDTQYEDFATLLSETAVNSDMALAAGSAITTVFALMIHTRSFFLSFVGIVQICLSFPLAYFTYYFLGGLTFFPFLNFIGVFVVFALGADHVFVAVDKWKNARKDFPEDTTEEIAAKALPDSAEAMLLTTSTTAIAFFGTAICPVAPVRLFAIFCGLLIVWDYIMDILLVFPSLCIYDQYLERVDKPNCCMTCHCCHRFEGGKHEINDDSELVDKDEAEKKQEHAKYDDDGNMIQNLTQNLQEQAHELNVVNLHNRYKDIDEDHKPSLIRRVLLGYYHVLHTLRYPLLVACAVAYGLCLWKASQLRLPLTPDVRLFREDHEFEKSNAWRLHLLSDVLYKSAGSYAVMLWGTIPADTGDHNNPRSWSQLVLDDSFDPSTTEAQEYMLGFCDKFFNQTNSSQFDEDACPIDSFDAWLRSEWNASQTENATVSEAYLKSCGFAWGLPISPSVFHECTSAWADEVDDYRVLSRDGIVEIIFFEYASPVRYDSPSDKLDEEWHATEDWLTEVQKSAPPEVSKAFFSSHDFWWYDTNLQMFSTALGSAAIAISASAVIILLSSRSIVMTIFSVLCVGYVLSSVTAMIVTIGWRLGFLESICFAILIGISVDFVIHLSHAYTSLPGTVPREKRAKHALIYMGPSILAAAVTTIAGAAVMLFCIITFFTKFATILFFTIIQSILGSFVVFLVLADTLGPATPTYMADKLCGVDTTPDESTKASTKETKPAQVGGELADGSLTKTPDASVMNNEMWGSVLEEEVEC